MNDSLVLEFRMVAKVDKKFQLQASRIQVVQQLSPMFIRQDGNGFQFQDDLLKTDKVSNITMA
jgi:hypothetical protein